MNIIIFGPPGAGKGTQSNFIVKKYKLHQLSTGELLRKEIKEKTKLGQQIESKINSGNLVSDETAGDLIEKYEDFKRGYFSGAIGGIQNGDFDFNVIIRSLIYNESTKSLTFSVGSAITFLCDAEQEYEECLLKASAIQSCFE